MNDDAFQGMLFGAISADDETTEDGPVDELRLCALNVNSPNPSRAQHIVNWLLATKSNTLVLTEMRPSEGGRHILACLQAEGFTTTCTPGWTDSRYLAVVATRGVGSALSTCSVRRVEEIIQCMVEEGRSGPLGWFRRPWSAR